MLAVEQGQEGVSNVMRVEALETVYGCVGGAKLWRANPMSGFGMK
jgi:hypothetical protein